VNREGDKRSRGRTQAVYYRYRDRRGEDHEPVNEFLEELLESNPLAVAKIDDQIDEHLNGRPPGSPPPNFPISSQVAGSYGFASPGPATASSISARRI
jgi:hypothetical protein